MERGGSQRIGGGVAKGNEFAIDGGGICGDGITRDKWQGTEIDVSGIRGDGWSEVTGADGIGISADGEVYFAGFVFDPESEPRNIRVVVCQ